MLLLTLLPVLFKFGAGDACWRALFGAAPGVALRTGLYLAQAGEFGFVLLTLAQRQRSCCRRRWLQPGAGRMVLSMLATPLHHDVQQPHRDAAVGERLAACSRSR